MVPLDMLDSIVENVLVDIAKQLDLIERHQRREGESQGDYCRRVFDVTRQTVDVWRKGGSLSANSRDLIDRLYQEARRWQADAGRTDDDHRRRAMAAVNLLEGRALKVLADLGVTLSAAQEFGDGLRQQAASAAVASAEAALRSLQMSQQTPVPAG